MELTLTGASLTSDGKFQKATCSHHDSTCAHTGSSHGGHGHSDKIPNANATATAAEHLSHSHLKHSSQHAVAGPSSRDGVLSGQQDCCDKHRGVAAGGGGDYRPVESIPREKLISNPEILFSAIIASVKGGSFDTFRYLVDMVIQEEKERQCALLWGTDVEDESTSVVSQAVNQCQSALGKRDRDGHTIVHWTAKRTDDIRFLEYLTSQVKNINVHVASSDNVGMTPLHWAATEGSIPIVNFLLKYMEGKNVNNGLLSGSVSSWKNESCISIHNSNHGEIRPAHHHPINARDKAGCTPLLIASQYGHADLAAFLIKRGADPNAVDESKDTALHWAAYKGAVPVCGLLLHLNGIQDHLDAVDAFGQTPLHLASLRGNTDVITYIIEQAEVHEDSAADGGSSGGGGASGTGVGVVGNRHSKFRFPAKLLNMKDRDGKTPIDLAIKKKKPHAEMLLRQYMTQYSLYDQSMWQRFVSIVKLFFSCRSWLSWLGLISENGRPPRFIFWFVAVNMALAFLYELTVYVPVLVLGGSMDSGRLWDYMTLHWCTISSFVVTWVSFIMVHRTDPGLLAKRNFASSNSGNAAIGMDYCIDSSPVPCLDENRRIRREMHTLTNDLRNMYEETLESFASDDGDKGDRLPLCHSCHIARPHRSKHCRVLNRCVLLFDHHCPFVGTTIGLYNYRYFYLYVVSFTITEILFTTTGILYLKKAPPNVGLELTKLLTALYFSIYMIMTGGLSIYHTQLVRKNLTTNEHQNFLKYEYLKDENGGYRNPYNLGCFRNFVSRMFPHKKSYSVMVPNYDTRHSSSVYSVSEEADIEMGQASNIMSFAEKLSLVKNSD